MLTKAGLASIRKFLFHSYPRLVQIRSRVCQRKSRTDNPLETYCTNARGIQELLGTLLTVAAPNKDTK